MRRDFDLERVSQCTILMYNSINMPIIRTTFLVWRQLMALIRKSISFTEQHDEWLKSQIESGRYANESEYIRDLIRRDQHERDVGGSGQTSSDGTNTGANNK